MLRFTNLRRITKLLFDRPVANFNVAEPRHLVYPWEGMKDNNDKYQKTNYVAPLKGRFKKKKEKQEFNKLKKMLTDKMEREMKGETQEKVEVKDQDVLFKEEEMPEARRYDKVPAKELYFIPRIENVYEYNNRKISYLTEFQEPFDIHDGAILSALNNIDKRQKEVLNAPITSIQDPDFIAAEIQQQDEQLNKLFSELRELIPKANHRLLPNICLFVGQKLRYKQDFAGVWEVLEKEVMKVIHNFSTIELAKIKFALNGTFPKAGSPRFHKALLDLAIEDLPALNASEIMHVFHAFRLLSKDRIYTKIVDQMITKGPVYIKNEPDTLANLLYTYANCRQKKHQRLMVRDPKEEWREANQLFEFFLPDLEEAIPNMSNDALVRLSLSVMLCRTQEYNDIILRIERTIRGKVATLDAFQTANFVYAFSKMNEGLMAGKATFYSQFEPLVVKHQDKFTNLEMSRLFYAYAARGVLSKDLKDKVFLPWVNKGMDKFDYATLANVAYGLMFIESNDKELWRRFARNVSTQKHRCPLTLYTPLKIARYYIQMLYPKWDLSYYEDTCFEAERYFNIGRLQDNYNREEYFAMTKILKYDINYWDAKMWLEWENLFIVDYALLPNKVAILIKKDRDCLPNSTEPRPIYKLRKRILEGNGWTILDVDWQKFQGLGPERNSWLKAELDKLMAKTKENIILDEERRRDEVVQALDDTYEEINLNVGREIKTTLMDKF